MRILAKLSQTEQQALHAALHYLWVEELRAIGHQLDISDAGKKAGLKKLLSICSPR